MPASRWDSYKETLSRILDAFEPVRVFEWGPGHSTDIIATFRSVDKLISVEHEKEYYEKMLTRLYPGFYVIHKPDLEEYAAFKGDGGLFDMIFVDGRNRSRCLREAKGMLSPQGVLILHDAARKEYREAVEEWRYRVFTDGGNTVVLTQNKTAFEKAESILIGVSHENS